MKYIVNLDDEYTVGGKIGIPVTINGHTAWISTGIELVPYTKPDIEAIRKKAYDKGKNDAYSTPVLKEEVEEAYQKGLNKAWDAARKIESLSAREFDAVFTGYDDYSEVFENYTPQEVIEKIGQYERVKEKQIQVGDEVVRYGDIGIITKISDDGDHFNVMWENGSTGYIIGDFKKTGRNFPEIAEVFRKMVLRKQMEECDG